MALVKQKHYIITILSRVLEAAQTYKMIKPVGINQTLSNLVFQ